MGYNGIFDDNGDDIYDDDDSLLKDFNLPPGIEEKRVVLQIMDSGGNIEDIIFDIEEIYKYVKNIYEKCPERN
jgi:hypothetical protein